MGDKRFRVAIASACLMNPSGLITLLIATRNAHKVAEIRAILGEQYQYLTLNDFPGAPAVVEDADNFAGNATKKAVALARWCSSDQWPTAADRADKEFVLADDSGLEVDALGGSPGVHSARFAALDSGKPGNSSTADNNAKLLRLLANVPMEQRKARFRCVIALTPVLLNRLQSASPVCYADEFEMQTELCEGACEGRIQFTPSGQGGFGYDPLFIPDGYTQSFAELGEEIKNQISHRAKALQKLNTLLARGS
jgi:XTP/dITP diphosphohydrolase